MGAGNPEWTGRFYRCRLPLVIDRRSWVKRVWRTLAKTAPSVEKTSGVRKRESEIWENGGGRQHPAPSLQEIFGEKRRGGGAENKPQWFNHTDSFSLFTSSQQNSGFFSFHNIGWIVRTVVYFSFLLWIYYTLYEMLREQEKAVRRTFIRFTYLFHQA